MKQHEGKVYDPVRGKYVHATPEEYVRQKTIQFLIDYMEIPSDRIIVERSLSKLGVEGDRRRIDIGFFDPEVKLLILKIVICLNRINTLFCRDFSIIMMHMNRKLLF